MYQILQVLAVVLVAAGMGLSLAHTLEFPGKRRLAKDAYFTVQSIYYPGFTLGGMFGEAGAMLAVLALLISTPTGHASFPFVVCALVALALMHAIFWMVTQPVNRVWLRDAQLGTAGAMFFDVPHDAVPLTADWTQLRSRWEYSHAARAVCGVIALVMLTLAVLR